VTDPDLVKKKLAAIHTYVHDLRSLATDVDLAMDVLRGRGVLHTLQMAIQACLDIASHIVSDDHLGEPRTNRDLFLILARSGWIDAALADSLRRMAGFRNVLVHGYDTVDLGRVRRLLEDHVGDLLAYAAAIQTRLAP